MTVTTSHLTQLLRGLAARLDAAGVGTYSPPGSAISAGVAATPAIVVGPLRQDTGVTIALQDYSVEDTPGLADSIVGVQAWIRGDRSPDTARDIEAAVLAALEGFQGLAGTVWVDHLYRQSVANVGPDSAGNFERSSNFYAHLNRPGGD